MTYGHVPATLAQQGDRVRRPEPRTHVASLAAGSKLYLHGGSNLTPMEDLFVLDLEERHWSEILLHDDVSLLRYGHCISVTNQGLLYTFGGVDDLGTACVGLFRLMLQSTEER